MTVCVGPSSPVPTHPFPSFPTIFRQQQIFIWQFTRGLCSPGCRQPRSFSAASQWFPGCTLPHFPPVEEAKHWDHTLSSVQRPTSGYRTGRARLFSNKQAVMSKTEAGVSMWWRSGCGSNLKNKSVVLVRHLQRHGGPHLHNGWQRDAHFGLWRLDTGQTQHKSSRLTKVCKQYIHYILRYCSKVMATYTRGQKSQLKSEC